MIHWPKTQNRFDSKYFGAKFFGPEKWLSTQKRSIVFKFLKPRSWAWETNHVDTKQRFTKICLKTDCSMILQFNGKYHLQEAGNRTQPNKHKFVQKVAKKNILLISFELSINSQGTPKFGGFPQIWRNY